MGYTAAFGELKFRPRIVPDNDTRPDFVEFVLTPVSDENSARLKAFMYSAAWMSAASASLITDEMVRNALTGIRNLRGVFADGVDEIRGLSVPVKLAVKAKLLTKEQAATQVGPIAITTGEQFDTVAPYLQGMSCEVAMKLAELSAKSEIDSRFFDSPSTSPEKPASRSGGARRAKKRRGGSATAD